MKYYIPLILEEKDYDYIANLVIKDLESNKAIAETFKKINEWSAGKIGKSCYDICQEEIEQSERVLEQLRYFYRHNKTF
jgi:hypothetical protein